MIILLNKIWVELPADFEVKIIPLPNNKLGRASGGPQVFKEL